MNPLVSTKRAGRLLVALAAMTSLFLMTACGSGNGIVKPNPVGFSLGSLNGTYVFSSSGTDDLNGAPLALAGALVADGKGGIKGGTMDFVDQEVTPVSPVAQAITGSYNVSPDGRGQATLNSSAYGAFTLDFVLTSGAHGLVTEFDGNGTGSGTIDLQTAVTSLSQLAGAYVFSLAGADVGDATFATAGAFTLNSSGAINAGTGVEDFNAGGIPYLDESLTGSTTLGSGTGPGTITLNTTAFNTLTFDVYPIDATHLKLIETDYAEFLSGDVFTQTSASIPTGPMVFTMAGGTTTNGPIADGGLMTSTGNGNFSNGLEDINDSGTVSPAQLPFGGTAASSGIGGRVVVDLTGSFTPASQLVIYPFSGGLLMLEADAANVTVGAAYVQTATSFSASNYGLNLTGANSNGLVVGEVDDIAQFDTTSAVSPAINLTGALDENSLLGGPDGGVSLSGTYAPDPTADGRGSISVPRIGTFIGTLNLEYYVVDASTIVFIEGDQDQLAVGTFELQSAPSSGGAVKSHVAIVHPTVRSHGALRRK